MSIENQNTINQPGQPENLFNQVDQQIAAGQPATVLVERSNGDITTGQVTGITEGITKVYLGDVTDGPTDSMAFKLARNEGLTDQYQEHLAAKLAGVALRTESEYVYETLLRGTDEQLDALAAKQQKQAEQQAAADWEAARPEREHRAADYKYNQARLSGATHEEAERSARTVYKQR